MKKLIFLLTLGLILGLATSASAGFVSGAATGDNWVWVWMSDGPWNETGTNFWKWQLADSYSTSDVAWGQPINFYFAVMNEDPSAVYPNPAGFLAEFNTSGWFVETGTGQLLSHPDYWEVAVVDDEVWELTNGRPPEQHYYGEDPDPDAPIFDPTDEDLDWESATSYGANNANPAQGWNWTLVAGIDGNAEWLWTEDNYYDEDPDDMDHLAVFRTTITPVPEPASMLLLGIGLIGLAGRKVRKRFMA